MEYFKSRRNLPTLIVHPSKAVKCLCGTCTADEDYAAAIERDHRPAMEEIDTEMFIDFSQPISPPSPSTRQEAPPQEIVVSSDEGLLEEIEQDRQEEALFHSRPRLSFNRPLPRDHVRIPTPPRVTYENSNSRNYRSRRRRPRRDFILS